jgi:phosphotransferase system HPr (HPr) family protein
MSASSEPSAAAAPHTPGAPAGAPAGGPSVEIPVLLPADLHARPAGQIAQTTARFAAAALLQYGERTANAASVLAVMSLGATRGRTVIVRAQGPDAQEAAAALAEVLATAT